MWLAREKEKRTKNIYIVQCLSSRTQNIKVNQHDKPYLKYIYI